MREERLGRQELAHLLVQMPPRVNVGGEILAQLLNKRLHFLLDDQVALELVPALLRAMLAASLGWRLPWPGASAAHRCPSERSGVPPVAQAGKTPRGHSPVPKPIGSFRTGGPEQLLDGVHARPHPMVHLHGPPTRPSLVEVPLCSTGPGTSFQVGELARLAICHPHGDVELRPLLLPLSTPNADLALGMLVDDVLRWRACAQCCPGESGLPVQHWTPRY